MCFSKCFKFDIDSRNGLNKIFTVCNFGNTLAVTIMFFSKCLKFEVDSRNGTKNREKFFVFQIIAFELGVAYSHNLKQDTWHRMSMCLETTPTFHLTLGETFSKSTFLRMMKKHD